MRLTKTIGTIKINEENMKKRFLLAVLATATTLLFSQPQAAALTTGEAETAIPEAAKLYMEAVPLAPDSLKRAQLLNQAEEILTGVIDHYPDSLEAHRKLLGVYMLKQDYTNGIRTVQNAITLSPEDPKLFITLAFFYEHSGALEYSKAMLDQALQLAPNNKLATDYQTSIQKKINDALLQSSEMHKNPEDIYNKSKQMIKNAHP
jgi:tetratricopeptide (TPR) repeat protein